MKWIIGNKGMLGRELSRLFEERGIDFIGSDRDVSILDSEALSSFLDEREKEGRRVDCIINCSAYTAVENAEKDPLVAFAINREGVGNIADIALKRSKHLIHVSTDYVFDGTSSLPLGEEAPVDPIGVYGKSKYEGE